MKTIRLTLIACALLLSLPFVSCSKSGSPVEEYVEILNTATTELSNTNSDEEATKIIAVWMSKWPEQAKKIMESHADYRLTSDDKQLLRDAMKRYMEITLKKSLEISQQPTDGVQEMAASILESAIYPAIDQAETLGDIVKTKIQ